MANVVAASDLGQGLPRLPFALTLHCVDALSLNFLPNRTPLVFAYLRPSSVRALINSRSNSARPPSTVSISPPCGVVVSAQASASDLKPAPALPTASRTRILAAGQKYNSDRRHTAEIARYHSTMGKR
jgi:hypothetical protein